MITQTKESKSSISMLLIKRIIFQSVRARLHCTKRNVEGV